LPQTPLKEELTLFSRRTSGRQMIMRMRRGKNAFETTGPLTLSDTATWQRTFWILLKPFEI